MPGFGALRGGSRLLLLGLGLVTVGACGDREPTGGDAPIRTTEFVEIIVALRAAEMEIEQSVPPDSVQPAFALRKSDILDQYGVTEDDVRAFVEQHHARPGFLAEVWDTIAQRLRAQPPQPVADTAAGDEV